MRLHQYRMISTPVLAALALAGAFAPAALAKLLVPMDLQQTDHLRAYGVAYRALERGENVEWLLNYRGGSFLLEGGQANQRECLLAGVAFEDVGGAALYLLSDLASGVTGEIHHVDAGYNVIGMKAEDAPDIALA